ncbi:30S ribosomal protein S6 [Patescibacteria group bacterium]|nr:30S ribosomal protein S6 [Patescibacteria group bacterium]MBU4512192.1 30S ribosomal protein S6 [Patescibacteria group bacterium]MCG2693458.1 30S ribosomal protein S6 [Candidatus Parcubacteria bacterium]
MLNHYELLYIIPVNFTEKEVKPIIDKINNLIKSTGGKIVHEEKLVKRKLAYPIKHVRHGYFIANEVDSNPETIEKLTKELKLVPEVLRFQVTKKRPGGYKPTVGEAKRKKTIEKNKAVLEKIPNQKIPEITETIQKEIRPTTKQKKSARPKISLDELGKKLDKILEEDI